MCIAVKTSNFKSSLTWQFVVSWLWDWIAWPGSALSLTGRSWADWSWRLWGWEHPAGWNMERKDWRETLHYNSPGLQSLHSDKSGKCCAAVFPHISPSSYQSHCHYLTLHESMNHHLFYRFIHFPNLLLVHVLASYLFLFRFPSLYRTRFRDKSFWNYSRLRLIMTEINEP